MALVTLPNAVTLHVLTRLYYTTLRCDELTTEHEQSQSYSDALRWLVDQGLVNMTRGTHKDGWCITTWTIADKGKVLINHFLATPLPVSEQRWVIPQKP